MRNLRNIKHVTFNPPPNGPLSGCAWDVLSDDVFFASGPSEQSTLIELRRCPIQSPDGATGLESTLIASWDAPCPLPDLACDRVLDVQHFSDTASTCLVLTGGDIVVVREQPLDGEEKIEIVGSVDVGIAAAEWSPDEELLAICTNGNTLLFMTRDFDNVASVDILADDLKASKHVSVGWGKAETQFRGKGAKALRDPTMPEKVEEGLLSSNEDQSTTISWRGDGQYVALNSLQASHRRVIRIYSREGELDGVTEPVDYLEGALSWRPAGNLLAGVQRLNGEAKVIFFERNGLRHGEFSLRLSEKDLQSWASSIRLSWNVDSSVLAVIYRDRVQLWTMGNYHYYLKSEIMLPEATTTGAPSLKWHPERSLLFVIANSRSEPSIKILGYHFVVCRGATNQPYDNGAVAVIDGGILKLTDLKYSNVPPPMAAHDIYVGSNVLDCAMKNLETRKIRIAALTKRHIHIIDWDVNEPSRSPIVQSPIAYEDQLRPRTEGTTPLCATQVAFSGSESLVLLCSQGADTVLCSLSLSGTETWTSNPRDISGVREISQNGEGNDGRFYLGLTNGDVLIHPEIAHQDFSISSAVRVEIQSQWDSLEVIQPNSFQSSKLDEVVESEDNIVVSLTKNGQLSANRKVLVNNCTSYLVTREHIIFTTSKHLLKFVHVGAVEQLEIPPDTPEADERCRSIERGAKLVTVIPSRSALILQMPRGNLETIYPRALVLAGIRRDINRKNYKKAFLTCRSQRVDMNILHDQNPPAFLEDVSVFINQLEKIEYIDLFLSQLRDEDVSLTMYKETSKKSAKRDQVNGVTPEISKPNARNTDTKVNRICNKFIQSLRPSGLPYLQSLITAHVCKSPPDLVSGLKEVSKLQQEGSKAVESAIEHICFLVDVNKLYDAALGLYDLQLALLVAQQSQKDPREYLPFLNNLHAQPSLRMKYEIDNHLGRRRLCLEHLQALKAFEELKAYTEKHELYQDALELYRYQEDKIEELMKLYAAYLTSRSRHKDAGVAFEYLHDYEAACEAYRLANLWREALTSAYAAGYEEDRIEVLARTLSDGLIESKDYTSAAIIVYEHLHDVEGAAKLFCKAYLFPNAARILSLNGRRDLLEKVLDAGLVEGMASMTELLADCRSQLNAQVPRIRELRIKKAQEPLSFYDAGANEGIDIPDNVSLAATDASTIGGTLLTRYTNRTGTVGTNATRKTAKNKRREERKRAMGKKGSVYEEEYLVNSVRRLIERVNAAQDDVSRLVMGLVQRRMRERAKAVQGAMTSLVELCQECIPEVFQQVEQDQKVQGTLPERPDGADGVHWDSMEALRQRQEPPVVKQFARLSLVGGNA